jgi:hypothetical protein
MTGHWRKLHNDEFKNFCSSPNIIRVMKSTIMREGHVADMGERRHEYKVGKPEEKG